MILFRTAAGLDILIALIFVFFFFWGLSDGTVSSFNIGLWLLILGGIAAILAGGFFLNSRGQRGAAIAVLMILGLPGIVFGLFMLLVIILQPRWN
jgi:hypothetical protein